MRAGTEMPHRPVVEAAAEVSRFLSMARDCSSTSEAGLALELASRSAMRVAEHARCGEIRRLFLHLAASSARRAGNEGDALRIRETPELRMPSGRRTDDGETNELIKRRVLDEMDDYIERCNSEVLDSYGRRSLLRHLSARLLDQVDRMSDIMTDNFRLLWGCSTDGGAFIGMNLRTVSMPYAELMSDSELQRFVTDVDRALERLALGSGCSRILLPEDGREERVGISMPLLQGHLMTFAHNRFRISVNPTGHLYLHADGLASAAECSVVSMIMEGLANLVGLGIANTMASLARG